MTSSSFNIRNITVITIGKNDKTAQKDPRASGINKNIRTKEAYIGCRTIAYGPVSTIIFLLEIPEIFAARIFSLKDIKTKKYILEAWYPVRNLKQINTFIKDYEGLINTLKTAGYIDDETNSRQNLFVFNYDWRKPLNENAETFKNFLDTKIIPKNQCWQYDCKLLCIDCQKAKNQGPD